MDQHNKFEHLIPDFPCFSEVHKRCLFAMLSYCTNAVVNIVKRAILLDIRGKGMVHKARSCAPHLSALPTLNTTLRN